MMTFSLDETWRDTASLLRANSSLLLPLGGVFFLMPLILYSLAAPEFVPPQSQNQQVMARAMAEHLRVIGLPLLLLLGVMLLGTGAIYHLLLDRDRPTVGAAIGGGARSWPSLLLLGVITFLAQVVLLLLVSTVGAMLGLRAETVPLLSAFLLVANVYIGARLIAAGPVIVAERLRDPRRFVRRGLALTRGKGWRIVLFVLALLIAGSVLILAFQFILGGLLVLLGGEAGRQIATILNAALVSVFLVVLTVAIVAIYRRLSRPTPAMPVETSTI